MLSNRIYERDTDALFLRVLRNSPQLTSKFAELVTGTPAKHDVELTGQMRHAKGTGSVDIVLTFRNGPVLLIENKIDAAYSITRDGLLDRPPPVP